MPWFPCPRLKTTWSASFSSQARLFTLKRGDLDSQIKTNSPPTKVTISPISNRRTEMRMTFVVGFSIKSFHPLSQPQNKLFHAQCRTFQNAKQRAIELFDRRKLIPLVDWIFPVPSNFMEVKVLDIKLELMLLHLTLFFLLPIPSKSSGWYLWEEWSFFLTEMILGRRRREIEKWFCGERKHVNGMRWATLAFFLVVCWEANSFHSYKKPEPVSRIFCITGKLKFQSIV